MLRLPPAVAAPAAFAVGLLALYSAADLFQLSASAVRDQKQDPYLAGAQDARFAALAAAVPAGETLAYVADLDPASAAGQAMYYTAQYALAPRLLVRLEKTGAARVVGNFTRPPDLAALKLTLVKDFGNGVMLLARVAGN